MNAGYVYVVAFDSGLIKVGQTKNASVRLNAHRQTARSFGLTVTDKWQSPLHVGWLENEQKLKRIARELGGQPTTPEYFSGLSFDALTEKARELPFEPPDAPGEIRQAAPAKEECTDTSARDAAIGAAIDRFYAIQPLLKDRRTWKIRCAEMFLDCGLTPEDMLAIRPGRAMTEAADLMRVIRGGEAKVRLEDGGMLAPRPERGRARDSA